MVDLICPVCGTLFQKSPSYVKKVKIKTCSLKCMGIWNSKNRHGELSSGWKDGRQQTNYICGYCNKFFIAAKCEDRKYCSPECGHKDKIGKPRPKRGRRIKLTCEWCGDEFERRECNITKTQKYTFCSIGCKSKWTSENTSGENSHCWISDRTKLKNYGTNKIRSSTRMQNWKKMITKRDNYICQICGCDDKKLNAHHIKAFKDYPELAFDTSNGITLCVGCHKEVTWGNKNDENLFDMIVNGFEC